MSCVLGHAAHSFASQSNNINTLLYITYRNKCWPTSYIQTEKQRKHIKFYTRQVVTTLLLIQTQRILEH